MKTEAYSTRWIAMKEKEGLANASVLLAITSKTEVFKSYKNLSKEQKSMKGCHPDKTWRENG